jgi:plastocyanin
MRRGDGRPYRPAMTSRLIAPAALLAAGLLVPAGAQAATKTVSAGIPVAQAKGMPPESTGNAFYPKTLKVNAGDDVAFKIAGLHNVVFPVKGEAAPAFHAPDPAAPVAGVKDAAGADFWFNGQPNWGLNMALLAPGGDNVVDGKALDGSGVFAGQGAPPDYVVSFPKRGTYTYLCSIHPGMKGKVKVLPKGAEAPSRAKDAKTVKRQVARTVKLARKLAAETPKGAVVRAGNDKREVAFFAFSPGVRSVRSGQSVTFAMAKGSREMHNVVFGPQDVLEATAAKFIAPSAAGLGYDPLSVYASDRGGVVVDGASHGNGFANTGLLDDDERTPFPARAKVTFTRPGSYGFICTVHGPSMKGTIRVS